MSKLKNTLILLLSAALIALGAALPEITAALADRETVSRSGTRKIPTFALDIADGNGEPRSLSAAGKIDLLRDGRVINISENEARMTEAEVNAAAEAAMAAYIDAGIFEWFDYTAWNVQPKLCVDPDTPENYSIFWMVTIINENEPYQSLGMDIDDETGKVYSIRYDVYGEYQLDGVWERNYAVMDTLVHVYLTQLGLLDPQQNVEPNIVYGELDGEVLCGGLFFENEEFDLQRIEFYVTGTGAFWIYFPE